MRVPSTCLKLKWSENETEFQHFFTFNFFVTPNLELSNGENMLLEQFMMLFIIASESMNRHHVRKLLSMFSEVNQENGWIILALALQFD